MFDGVEWWRFQELEIPEEDEDRTKDPTNSSSRSFLTSPNDSSSLSSSVGSGESCRDELQSLPVPTPQALEVPSPAQEWLCEHPNCGRSFTHRYRLKYVSSQPNHLLYVSQLTMLSKHQKYHNKLHRCLEPSCLARRVKFSREQDLIRHQSQHSGRRFYCPYIHCSYAVGGAKDGFTRKDNQKRHIANQHRHAQQQ